MLCYFTHHMINKKESFEITHIENDEINNQSFLSYVWSKIFKTRVNFWLILADIFLVPVGRLYMTYEWREGGGL